MRPTARWVLVPVVVALLAAGAGVWDVQALSTPGSPPDDPTEDPMVFELPDGDDPLARVELPAPDLTSSLNGLLMPPPASPPADLAGVDPASPPIQVPRAALDAALECPVSPSEAQREVVLLIPGTTVDPHEAYSWNYERALPAEGIPYCTITLPNHTDGDIQVAAEYVVDAVRRIHAASGRRVILLGWSQGASTLPRWALRWWPDIRPMVASLIQLAPVNNIGSPVGNGPCFTGSCIPAAWQQSVGSRFMAVLNSGPQTFPEVAYTSISSRFDEVAGPQPNLAIAALPEGPNVRNYALSDVCALDLSEHLTIPASPTAFAIALDAIRHPGQPADLRRVRVTQPCLPGTMPHVDPLDLVTHTALIVANVGPRLTMGVVDEEPPLGCYVTDSCG